MPNQFSSDEIFQQATVLVLGGKAGSGKTECIHLLSQKGEHALDLEGLAEHKGSVFGNFGTPQQTNEQFHHRIFNEWKNFDAQQPVWIEEEGPFLGQNVIPPVLYQRMLAATMIELEVPFEIRLEHLLAEYGNEPAESFLAAIRKLEKRMGTSANHKALHFYQTGRLRDCFSLLLKYYDETYEQRRSTYRKGEQHVIKMEKFPDMQLVDELIAWRRKT